MSWFRRYHANLLRRIDEAGPWGDAAWFDAFLPVLIGGGLFAMLDYRFEPAGTLRLVLAAILLGPGFLWSFYVIFRETWLKMRYFLTRRSDDDRPE